MNVLNRNKLNCGNLPDTFAKSIRQLSARLWRYLRSRQMEGAKFRFQAPVEPYVADFLCVEERLIVELDGGQHGVQVEKDAARTEALEAAGYTVIRFWNNEVLANTEGVLETIRLAVFNAKGGG